METHDKQINLKKYLEQEIALGLDEITVAAPVSKPHKASMQASDALEQYRNEICECQKCPLGSTRITFVFGTGNPHAKIMFIGEGPGYEEDRRGEPFVGQAGKLLDNMIKAIGLERKDVYIANVVKCHPMKDSLQPEKRGNDRPPNHTEVETCLPYLLKQIDLIKPTVLCTLGGSAVQALMKITEGITRLRGKTYDFNGYILIPTFHPAALLRDPSLKRMAWEDLKKVRDACIQSAHE